MVSAQRIVVSRVRITWLPFPSPVLHLPAVLDQVRSWSLLAISLVFVEFPDDKEERWLGFTDRGFSSAYRGLREGTNTESQRKHRQPSHV